MCNHFMETLRLAKHTSAAVSSTEASLIQFYFLLEYPAEANLQRREVQLCLCRDMKLNTHTLTLELIA